jgi:hypothetical protein
MRKTQCSGCKRYFSNDDEFDSHRTGRFNVTPPERRCKTEAEMTKAGYVYETAKITDEPGQPVRQVWYRSALREKVRARFSARMAIAA